MIGGPVRYYAIRFRWTLFVFTALLALAPAGTRLIDAVCR